MVPILVALMSVWALDLPPPAVLDVATNNIKNELCQIVSQNLPAATAFAVVLITNPLDTAGRSAVSAGKALVMKRVDLAGRLVERNKQFGHSLSSRGVRLICHPLRLRC